MKKLLMLVVIILVLAAFLIISSSNYDLTEKEGRTAFVKAYFGWLGEIAKNAVSITSYAVKLQWLPR